MVKFELIKCPSAIIVAETKSTYQNRPENSQLDYILTVQNKSYFLGARMHTWELFTSFRECFILIKASSFVMDYLQTWPTKICLGYRMLGLYEGYFNGWHWDYLSSAN